MDIYEPSISSAAYILKKDMEARGVKLQHTEALDIAARMRGYADFQAFSAHEDEKKSWERPVLRQEYPDSVGSDYAYVGEVPGSVWLRVRNIDVHVICRKDGVDVELGAAGMADFGPGPVVGYEYEDAAKEFLRQSAHLDMTSEARTLVRAAGATVAASESGRFCVKGKSFKGLVLPDFATEEDALLATYAHLYGDEPVLSGMTSGRYKSMGNELQVGQTLLTLRKQDFRAKGNAVAEFQFDPVIPPYTQAQVSEQTGPDEFLVVFSTGYATRMALTTMRDSKEYWLVKDSE